MMTRALTIAALVALAGCSGDVPTPKPTPVPTAAATPAPANVLPASFVGRWAVTSDQCSRGKPLAITVEPASIRFYESVATITGVTPLPDGTYGIDANVTGEGRTEARSFDLKLLDGGKRLLRVEAPIPDITYTRCESET